MRKLLPFILTMLLVGPVLGQQDARSAENKAEFLSEKNWAALGRPTEGSRGFSLFSRNMKPTTDTLFEMWVKIVPANAAAFNRRFGLPANAAYAVQYATVDCTRKQITFEKSTVYNQSNAELSAPSSELVQKAGRKSGPIGETVFDYICRKL